MGVDCNRLSEMRPRKDCMPRAMSRMLLTKKRPTMRWVMILMMNPLTPVVLGTFPDQRIICLTRIMRDARWARNHSTRQHSS